MPRAPVDVSPGGRGLPVARFSQLLCVQEPTVLLSSRFPELDGDRSVAVQLFNLMRSMQETQQLQSVAPLANGAMGNSRISQDAAVATAYQRWRGLDMQGSRTGSVNACKCVREWSSGYRHVALLTDKLKPAWGLPPIMGHQSADSKPDLMLMTLTWSDLRRKFPMVRTARCTCKAKIRSLWRQLKATVTKLQDQVPLSAREESDPPDFQTIAKRAMTLMATTEALQNVTPAEHLTYLNTSEVACAALQDALCRLWKCRNHKRRWIPQLKECIWTINGIRLRNQANTAIAALADTVRLSLTRAHPGVQGRVEDLIRKQGFRHPCGMAKIWRTWRHVMKQTTTRSEWIWAPQHRNKVRVPFSRDRADAWVYRFASTRQRREYIGSTWRANVMKQALVPGGVTQARLRRQVRTDDSPEEANAGHQANHGPRERFLEHIASFYAYVTRFQGGQRQENRRSNSAIPFYHLVRGQRFGLSSLVFQPLFGLLDPVRRPVPGEQPGYSGQDGTHATQTQRRNTRVFRPKLTRSDVLRMERNLHLRWRPAYVAPWCYTGDLSSRRQGTRLARPHETRRHTDPTLESTHASVETAGCTDEVFLVNPDGSKWQGKKGRTWAHQFHRKKLRLNDLRPWSLRLQESTILKILKRKQMPAQERILRHCAPATLQALLATAQRRFGAVAESTVLHAIRNATASRTARLHLNRMTLRNKPYAGPTLREAIESTAPELPDLLARHDMIVKIGGAQYTSVARALQNETKWQAAINDQTECACASLLRWTRTNSRQGNATFSSNRNGETHHWTTWGAVLAHSDSLTGGAKMLIDTLTTGGVPKQVLAMTPTTLALATAKNRGTRLQADEIYRVIHRLASIVTDGIPQQAGHVVYQGIHSVISTYNATEAQSTRPTCVTVDSLYRCAPWNDWVIQPLDKWRGQLRLSCPRLAYLETVACLEPYHQDVARCNTPGAKELIREHDERRLNTALDFCPPGLSVADIHPDKKGLGCRATPKGKDPGNKCRLVVSYQHEPARDILCAVARTLELTSVIGVRLMQEHTLRPTSSA